MIALFLLIITLGTGIINILLEEFSYSVLKLPKLESNMLMFTPFVNIVILLFLIINLLICLIFD